MESPGPPRLLRADFEVEGRIESGGPSVSQEETFWMYPRLKIESKLGRSFGSRFNRAAIRFLNNGQAGNLCSGSREIQFPDLRS